MKRIVLASGSPRRRELLAYLNYEFEVIVSDIEEKTDPNLKPVDVVKSLAYQKANAVFAHNMDAVVIGSDTIVVCNDKILGKPHDKIQAREMMEMLKNNCHTVLTAVAFISNEEKKVICDRAVVHFDNIEEDEIEKYVATAEPYDKAGGYAIQGWAAKYIRSIEGNYYTIMGLPVDLVYEYLKNMKNK